MPTFLFIITTGHSPSAGWGKGCAGSGGLAPEPATCLFHPQDRYQVEARSALVKGLKGRGPWAWAEAAQKEICGGLRWPGIQCGGRSSQDNGNRWSPSARPCIVPPPGAATFSNEQREFPVQRPRIQRFPLPWPKLGKPP